jgi:HSP20 family protein
MLDRVEAGLPARTYVHARRQAMAKMMKKEEAKREEGARPGVLAPVRRLFPDFPELPARMEEFFREPWALQWPLRWPEIAWPHELAKLPAMDVYEEGGALVVKAEVPGLAKEEIDVRVEGDVLTISGKKAKEEKVERKDYYRFERSEGVFSRTVRLPAEVEPEKMTAKLEKGVLEIRAPKADPTKSRSRKIDVA